MTDRSDERTLDQLDRLVANADPYGGDEPVERELVELFGLLAYDLEPEPPRPGLRAELLRRAAGAAAPLDTDEPTTGPVLVHDRKPTRPMADRPTSGRWAELLAAAAVLVAVLLGGLSLYLLGRLRAQSEDLTRLGDSVDRLVAAATGSSLDLARVATVTAPDTEFCTLASRDPSQPDARGVMFMNRGRRQWFLAADNLAPSPPDRLYRVWFVTSEGSVRGDSFRVANGVGAIELTADLLPVGTEAVMITLEEEESEAPGRTVLYGDQAQHFY